MAQRPAPSEPAAPARPRKRLGPREREQMIVEEAVRYFAEHGFEGETRALARQIGVSHALIFRYFPTKQALIDRVYEEVFLRRWNPEWEEWLDDRRVPLRRRLRRFYKAYYGAVDDYEWIRIALSSAMRRVNIMERYLSLVRQRLIRRIATELRAHYRLPPPDAVPLTALELQLVWNFHAFAIYALIAKHVYGARMPLTAEPAIDAQIDLFLAGARAQIKAALATPAPSLPAKAAR
ncbi:MAG: TetR/AcrR family transcriptional regulator [Alphaproteobacteria bacterium]